jgi:hypothetical protein
MSHISRRVPSCTDEALNAETCMSAAGGVRHERASSAECRVQIVLLRSFTSVLLSTLRSCYSQPQGCLSTLAPLRSAHVWMRRCLRVVGESTLMCITLMYILMCTKLHWRGVEHRNMHVCRLCVRALQVNRELIENLSNNSLKCLSNNS